MTVVTKNGMFTSSNVWLFPFMKKDNGINEILEHLELHGVMDKDSEAKHSKNVKKNKESKTTRKRHILDLHGLTSIEASRSLKITLVDCHQRGVKEILVIHGKGYHSKSESGPVLKGLVNQMLENELHYIIRSFASAKIKDGGDGATVVLLK